VIVTTTHKGVKDSELQKNKNDPIWHNHFVKLDKRVSGLCGNNPEVVDITFQSPGNVDVQDSKAILSDIPKKYKMLCHLSLIQNSKMVMLRLFALKI
jgi:hypothetical protein